MRLNFFLLVFLLLSAQWDLRSQQLEIGNVPFEFRYNPSGINGMAQDNSGYIWIADIGNGVFRYDGTNLIHYMAVPGNPNSLSSNRIECITTDSIGMVWIGTFDQGLNCYDPMTNTFTHFRHDEETPGSIRSDAIRALAVDSDGMIWIGTLQGLDKLDPDSGIFTHVHTNDPDEKLLGKEHIRVMYIDKSGLLWIGSSSPFAGEATIGGLFKCNMAANEITHYSNSEEPNSLINNMVRAIFEDSRGTFWIGTAGDGLHTMMLQHSRTSAGEKTSTDINALCDEYLRLAYHGLRAKDKSFNADFKTDFDGSLPKVNVIPQDIGRVLLNLINNAFFAVNQKAARHSDPERSDGEESENYQPEVIVSTKILPLTPSKGGQQHIEISVKDNGPGIPDEIKEKIFQPFFTTKPTGEGTGLGLSLSYDIVKAHGGELKVFSTFKEGLNNGGSTKPGTEFKVRLPI